MIRMILVMLLAAAPVLGQGYVCAEGGGNAGKGAWADEVFGWMVEKGGHGKVVLLGAVKLDEDDRPALFTRLGAKGVESLVVTQENADKQETYDAIAAASVVFIRGGAQDRYVRWWKGTKTQQAIVDVWKKGGVVAGTSAGCAVLGEVVYDALHGSLTAREALADARHEHLSLTTGFLNLVPGVLFDTHFTERGRLVRLPVMLAMCKEDLKRDDILGIGVDPRTAVCVGQDGIAEIKGEGTATLLRLTPESKIAMEKGKPPTVSDVQYTQLCAGYRIRLPRGTVEHKEDRPDGVSMFRGGNHIEVVSYSTASDDPIVVDGASAEHEVLGTAYLAAQPEDAWLLGPPVLSKGSDKLPYAALATRAFADKGVGNNMAGLQSLLADRRQIIGVWLDDGARLQAAGWRITVLSGGPEPRSALFLDAGGMDFQGHGPVPRRAPVMESARLYLLAPGWAIRPGEGKVIAPAPTP